MIKRVNLLVLQAVAAECLPPQTKEIVEDAIREICEWREMRKVNATALDALSEPAELQHFPGGGFAPKLMGEGSEMPKRHRA